MNLCHESQGCPIPNINPSTAESAIEYKCQLIFVTDPICSHCWAIEPQWRRFQLNFDLNVRYIHGGLLPGWKNFGDARNGISSPLDVIPHWNQVAAQTGQPIDSQVWKNDPISNSYILCQSALAVRHLRPEKESLFVRLMREQIFLFAKNVAKEHKLQGLAASVGIDPNLFIETLNSHLIQSLFEREQKEMLQLGARGFPTLIFNDNPAVYCYGSESYAGLERATQHLKNTAPRKKFLTDSQKLNSFHSWTLKEATEVLQYPVDQTIQLLRENNFEPTTVALSQLWVKTA